MIAAVDNKQDEKQRIVLTRIVFGFILFTIAYRFFNNALLHQMQAPVLKYPLIDYTYWLIHITHLPDIITSHKHLALLFDISLALVALSVFLFPLKRVYAISFTFLYFFYIICYNSYAMHHAHPMNGILILSIAFWPKKNSTFNMLWDGIRYMIIFIYADAFILKIINGAIFNPEQGMANVKENLGWIMLSDHTSIFTKDFYAFFLRHNLLIQIGYIFTVLLEGVVIVGFFTKKFDKYLFWCPIIIHLVNYFFIDVSFLETIIVSVVFLNLSTIPYLVEKLLYNLPKKMIPGQLG